MMRLWWCGLAMLGACDPMDDEMEPGEPTGELLARLWDPIEACWGPLQSLDSEWSPNQDCEPGPTLAEFYGCYRFENTCTPSEDVWALGCPATPGARLSGRDCD